MRHFIAVFACLLFGDVALHAQSVDPTGNGPCGGQSTYTYNGTVYRLAEIGGQCWFAENLRSSTYANGDDIPSTLTDSQWNNALDGATTIYGEDDGCTNYSPDIDSCDPAVALEEYGRLYNWYAVSDERQVCPSGWHVPVSSEWTSLFDLYGGLEVAGVHLKSTEGWSEAWGGTNSSGFGGLPSGYRMWTSGGYVDAGGNGVWWSSTDTGNGAMNALLWVMRDKQMDH